MESIIINSYLKQYLHNFLKDLVTKCGHKMYYRKIDVESIAGNTYTGPSITCQDSRSACYFRVMLNRNLTETNLIVVVYEPNRSPVSNITQKIFELKKSRQRYFIDQFADFESTLLQYKKHYQNTETTL